MVGACTKNAIGQYPKECPQIDTTWCGIVVINQEGESKHSGCPEMINFFYLLAVIKSVAGVQQ